MRRGRQTWRFYKRQRPAELLVSFSLDYHLYLFSSKLFKLELKDVWCKRLLQLWRMHVDSVTSARGNTDKLDRFSFLHTIPSNIFSTICPFQIDLPSPNYEIRRVCVLNLILSYCPRPICRCCLTIVGHQAAQCPKAGTPTW